MLPVSCVCVTLLRQTGDLAEQAFKSWLKIPSSGIWLEAYMPLISVWVSYMPQFLLWKVNQLLTLWGKLLVRAEYGGNSPHLCLGCWISILGPPIPKPSNAAEPGWRCSVLLQEVIYFPMKRHDWNVAYTCRLNPNVIYLDSIAYKNRSDDSRYHVINGYQVCVSMLIILKLLLMWYNAHWFTSYWMLWC